MSDPSTWQLTHIPIAHPLLTRGGHGAWDECLIEACDILEDFGTYYLYYHGTPLDKAKWPRQGYRLGVATASHPLGPFTKHPGNPVLDLGEPGGWEGGHVACAALLKEGADRYLMFYSAHDGQQWSIGLATAPSPLGPWTRHPDNPLLPGYGYVGGVALVDGTYHLWCEHPIGASGPDYGPLSHATAPAPEGPWTPRPLQPVLPVQGWGAWDDGGYSEAKAVYRDGLFHLFYGGAKLHPKRILSRESIGYAWSRDGVSFTRHPRNPVAPRQAVPNAAAFAEVHALLEPPLVYCYHTLRYVHAERDNVEDVGAQVLAWQRPFTVTIPLLQRDLLAPGETTAPGDCPPVSLSAARQAALTVAADFPTGKGILRAQVWPDADGLHPDSRPGESLVLQGAGRQQASVALDVPTPFARVSLRHEQGDAPLHAVELTVTLRG